jgi:hypothetical protein
LVCIRGGGAFDLCFFQINRFVAGLNSLQGNPIVFLLKQFFDRAITRAMS